MKKLLILAVLSLALSFSPILAETQVFPTANGRLAVSELLYESEDHLIFHVSWLDYELKRVLAFYFKFDGEANLISITPVPPNAKMIKI